MGWKVTALHGSVDGMPDPTAVPAGIEAQDWANTPELIRVFFVALREENAQLKARVAALEERAGKSSQNSSLPPSSDSPRVRRRWINTKAWRSALWAIAKAAR